MTIVFWPDNLAPIQSRINYWVLGWRIDRESFCVYSLISSRWTNTIDRFNARDTNYPRVIGTVLLDGLPSQDKFPKDSNHWITITLEQDGRVPKNIQDHSESIVGLSSRCCVVYFQPPEQRHFYSLHPLDLNLVPEQRSLHTQNASADCYFSQFANLPQTPPVRESIDLDAILQKVRHE